MNPLALLAGAAALLLARRRTRYAAQHVSRITRITADLDRAVLFYGQALDAQLVARTTGWAVLRLAETEVAFIRPARPGRAMRRSSPSNDLWFQHIALTVADMVSAYARLQATPGWRPISTSGPQLLPPENGGVRAFKFRDPDGHPLELLWFPPTPGQTHPSPHPPIDHTAIAVASTGRSLRFYRSPGFTVAHRTHNQGPAQDRLDGLAEARLDVTSLHPASPGTGLELLAYRPPGRSGHTIGNTDFAADVTSIVVAPAPGVPRVIKDPDGHRLLLIAAPPHPAPSLASTPAGARPHRPPAASAANARPEVACPN